MLQYIEILESIRISEFQKLTTDSHHVIKMEHLVYITIICIILLLFSLKGKTNECSLCISIDTTATLKFFVASTVIAHHISQRASLPEPLSLLGNMGPICVCIFLFLSGYGLTVSIQKKGKSYLHSFYKNRIIPFLIPFLIAVLIYQCFSSIYESKNQIMLLFYTKEFSIDNILPYSWYIIIQLYFYLSFWFLFSTVKSTMSRITLILLSGLVYYALIKYMLKFPPYWYNCSFAFPVGTLYGFLSTTKYLKNQIEKSKYALITLLFFVIAFIFHFFSLDLQNICISIGTVLVTNSGLNANKFIQYCGVKYSYAAYLMQGIAIVGFKDGTISISNDSLYILACIPTIAAGALGLHYTTKKLILWINDLCTSL